MVLFCRTDEEQGKCSNPAWATASQDKVSVRGGHTNWAIGAPWQNKFFLYSTVQTQFQSALKGV